MEWILIQSGVQVMTDSDRSRVSYIAALSTSLIRHSQRFNLCRNTALLLLDLFIFERNPIMVYLGSLQTPFDFVKEKQDTY